MAYRSVLIQWRARDVVADTTVDPDLDPDANPLPPGTKITITPAASEVADMTTTPPVTYYPQPIVCGFDADGDLYDPVNNAKGIRIIDPTDPTLQPHDWTLNIRVDIPSQGVKVYSARLTTPEPDGSYYLTRNMPVPAYTGTATSAAEYAAQAASSASAAAASAASINPGVAGGVATLDGSGHVPAAQVPDLQTALAPRLPRPRFPRLDPPITQCQSTDTWWGTTGPWNTNDTSDFVVGTQCISVAASSRTTIAAIQKTLPAAINLTGKHIAFLMKVDNLANLESIQFIAGDSSFTNYTQFIPVYGSASDASSTIRSGQWVWVFTTLACKQAVGGTGGLAAVTRIQFKVTPHAEGVPVTVRIQQISTFTPAPAFPNGAVMFTFDDCFGSQVWAEQVLAAQGIPANLYTIVDVIDAPPVDGIPWLTSAQIAHMHDVSGWEISGHAFTRAAHNAGYDTLTPDQLDAEFRGLKAWLLSTGYRGADHFAWPKGIDNAACAASARRYFATGRGINTSGTPKNQLPSIEIADMPLHIRAHVPASTDLESAAEDLIDRAYSSASLLVLGFHQLVDTISAPSSVAYLKSDFQAIVNKVVAKGIPVGTMSSVLKQAGIV